MSVFKATKSTYPGATATELRSSTSFAALKSDGSVVSWGGSGGTQDIVDQFSGGAIALFSSGGGSLAALKADGTIVTWPYNGEPAEITALADGVFGGGFVDISSTLEAFAALRTNGSVFTWGTASLGGDSSVVASQLTSGVTKIFSNAGAFAALKNDGSVVTWGLLGGDSSSVAASLNSGVVSVTSTESGFAALKSNGSVVTWGGDGGDSGGVALDLAGGVIEIFASRNAFAALKSGGSVVTWGSDQSGGDSDAVGLQLASGVVSITSSAHAFAALKSDGSVVTWGNVLNGADSSAVSTNISANVSKIYGNDFGFAAVKTDGSVVSWIGNNPLNVQHIVGDVIFVGATSGAFAALKSDGSVITWGDPTDGGNSSAVASHLTSGVVEVYATNRAFAALKSDGSVITWGNVGFGGNPGESAADLTSGVVSLGSITSVNCFLKGTIIGIPGGEATIEALQIGDRVLLADGGSAPIIWVGRRWIDVRRHVRPWDVAPIRILASAFGRSRPLRDLLLSPDHAIFADGALIPARYLVNGSNVVQEPHGVAEYWHIELAEHSVILAEGLPVETYLDTGNRSAFASSGSPLELHPEFARSIWAREGYAPLCTDGPVVEAVRSWLRYRAIEMGYSVTDDPELRLVVDDIEIVPARIGTHYRFTVPQGCKTGRLVSRTHVPAEMSTSGGDTRRLGVAVREIVLDGKSVLLDGALLGRGWYLPETDWRWTCGDAVIDCSGGRILDVSLADLGTYWITPFADSRVLAA